MTPVTAFDAFLPSLAFIDGVGGSKTEEMILIIVPIFFNFDCISLQDFYRLLCCTRAYVVIILSMQHQYRLVFPAVDP